jgi:hypothetical protein
MTQKILLFSNLFLICALAACNKDSNTPSGATTTGNIQYKVNGAAFAIDNVDILSGQFVLFQKQLAPFVPTTRYTFNAQKGANNIVLFSIITDSLKKITYHYDSTALSIGSTVGIVYNGQPAYALKKNDYFDITITDYSTSKVSGTFTAKLTPATSTGTIGTPSSVIITEGKLNNVQVIY